MKTCTPVFLATTALEEFWDTSQPIIFLNEWCKQHDKKSIWKNLDAKMLDDPQLDHTRSLEAFNYTIEVYQSLLPQLTNYLNQIHKTNYSIKYWQVVIGPFLLWYIQVVYIRYTYLKVASNLYNDISTIALAKNSYITPINSHEFCLFAAESDAWNLQIISQILSFSFNMKIKYREYNWNVELEQRKERFGKNPLYKKTTKLKFHIIKILSKLRTSTVGLCGYFGLSNDSLLKLAIKSRLRIFPFTQLYSAESAAINLYPLNHAMRENIKKISSNDFFTKLVIATLPANMPMNFLELYNEEVCESDRSFPYKSKVIVGAGWLQNDRLKFWGAKNAEKLSKLINVQHGGGYGAIKFCAYEFLERANFYKFISWGWSESKEIIAAPSITVSENKNRFKIKNLKGKNDCILWAVTEVDRYPAYIAGYLNYMVTEYFSWQHQFANSLNPKIIPQLILRVRPNSKYYSYWKDMLPNLNIHLPQNKASYFDQLCSAKIFICDNLNTTLLYALEFNIPTILFWNKKLFQIRDRVKPLFQALHKVGIYYDSPDAAASKLNDISDNPIEWWNTNEVQMARKQFCEKFAGYSNNWIYDWKDLLLTL